MTCRCLLHLKPRGSCPCCPGGVSWGVSLGGPARLGWRTEPGPTAATSDGRTGWMGAQGCLNTQLCSHRHTFAHTDTHTTCSTDVPAWTDTVTSFSSRPPGIQTCTDRLRCTQTSRALYVCTQQHVYTGTGTPTASYAHQQMCGCAHKGTHARACTPPNPHAHAVHPHPCTHTGGPCAPPQKCTHMNTHELTHTDTDACLCPHSFCLPGVLAGAPRAAAARQPLSGVRGGILNVLTPDPSLPERRSQTLSCLQPDGDGGLRGW